MNSKLLITEVKSTALFSVTEPLRQMATLKLRNSDSMAHVVQIRVILENTNDSIVTEESINVGDSVVNIWIPDIDIERKLIIISSDKNDLSFEAVWEGMWQPQRKWKIYIAKSSHYDLGYDGRVDQMQAEAADYMDLARRLCADKAQLHDWHYYLEHMGFIRAYERERGETKLRAFMEDYVKSGLMTLWGNPSGPHWHWMDYEQIARASYPARREMKDRFGIEVEGIAVQDNPNSSWAAYQAFAKAGFNYVINSEPTFRGPGAFQTLGIPRLFRMEGPNGKDRILVCMTNGYGEPIWLGNAGTLGAPYLEAAGAELSKMLKSVESGEKYGDYPYDTLVITSYVDWDIPHEEERVLTAWKRKWRYPEIHLDDAAEAFHHIEEKYGDMIPVLRGDTNNNSADYSSIDPQSQGIKRKSTRMLPFMEGLSAIAAKQNADFQYPGKMFNDLYIRMSEYDEHCWPTMLPGSDMNIFNTSIIKTHNARKIYNEVTKKIVEPIHTILNKGACGKEENGKASCVSVWNSLAHKRSDLVKVNVGAMVEKPVNYRSKQAVHVEDLGSGRIIEGQPLSTGEIAFNAEDMPAYGFKKFAVNIAEAGKNTYDTIWNIVDGDSEITLENSFYKLEVNKENGKVVVLEDKKLGRTLIDPEAPYSLNQWLRVSTGEFNYTVTSKELTITEIGKSSARLREVGPVMAQVVVETIDEAIGAKIETTYTLYRELDRLDINNKALRMDFLHTLVNDRYRENIFVAFPFQIENPRFRIEHSTGTIDPIADMLPSNRDFMMLNRWVDISNDKHGITLVSHESAAMHLGKIMYNQFSADYKPEKSHVYSYIWSNRMCGLTTLSLEDYHAELSYSIHSHGGDWLEGSASEFGWSQGSPLLPVEDAHGNYSCSEAENQKSFLNINSENVQLTVLKRAEKPGKGYVVRLVETEGKASANVKVTVDFMPVAKAWICDIVENDIEEIDVINGVIDVDISSYDMVTIRFTGSDQSFEELNNVKIQSEGDSRISLEWGFEDCTVEKRTGVNIFRSEDPEFLPSAHTLIAYTESVSFTDIGLKPGCKYYYYIAPANRDNIQGHLLGLISARTSLENSTPPAPVAESGVIPMDMDRLCLYWVKSPEPDIAFYKVYRGDFESFMAADENLLAEVEPQEYWYHTYMDTGLAAGITKYYRILPVDYAGNIQINSICVSGNTPLRKRLPEKRDLGL